jgi:hypothetical protein
MLAPIAPNLSDSARSGPHPCGNRRWSYKRSKSHLRRSLHQDTWSLRPRLDELVATHAHATCSNDTVNRTKDTLHEFRLGFPVVLVVLNDAEGINPEALQTETTGNIDSILERLWEWCDVDTLPELLDFFFCKCRTWRALLEPSAV